MIQDRGTEGLAVTGTAMNDPEPSEGTFRRQKLCHECQANQSPRSKGLTRATGCEAQGGEDWEDRGPGVETPAGGGSLPLLVF